jgi:uncharacterized protein
MRIILAGFAALLLAGAALAQDAPPELGIGKALLRAGNYVAALPKLEAAAAKGSAEAFNLLGLVYYEGSEAVPSDKVRSLAWFRKGAEAGNVQSMFVLARQFQLGEGTAPDPAQSAHWYERAASAGDVKSMYWTAEAYNDGVGVPQDLAKAAHWYRMAAEQGHRTAMIGIGYALGTGRGVPKDEAAAFRWYRKGGEAGSGTGAFNAGIFYRDGIAVRPNRAAAYYWFLRSAMAEAPHPEAGAALAQLREAGPMESAEGKALAEQAENLILRSRTDQELKANRPKSMALHKQAAELGHAPSIMWMMSFYRDGGGGVPTDAAKAREWAQIAAEMDDPEGQRTLAALMLRGSGGPRNAQGARFWYEKSALKGNGQSMVALAQIYEGELGLPPNEALAIYWYKEAYKQKWIGAEEALLKRGLLKPDPAATAFIQRIDSQGPDRSSLDAFVLDVAHYCKYGGSRCTALSREARQFERQHNADASAANTARLWNVYTKPGPSDAQWNARSACMRTKTESIQRHTYGQQDWYYSGSCH